MIKRIAFVAVPVADHDRALDFYTRRLGLRVFTDQTVGGMRWIELRIPGAETMVVLHKRPDLLAHDEKSLPALSLKVDSVQGTYDDLRAKGVEFLQPPQKEHWGEHAIFKDSEGNTIIFSKE